MKRIIVYIRNTVCFIIWHTAIIAGAFMAGRVYNIIRIEEALQDKSGVAAGNGNGPILQRPHD